MNEKPNNQLVPSDGAASVEVLGLSATAASLVIRHLTRHSVELAMAGVIEVKVRFEQAVATIRVVTTNCRNETVFRMRFDLTIAASRYIERMEALPNV